MSLPPIEPVENPDYDVCLWPVDPACLTDEWAALDPAVQLRSLALASATLRRLTGYRVGACPVTVRPCTRSCAEQYGYFYGGSFTPHVNSSGNWVNSCGCNTDCSCGEICEVVLPAPVTEIVEVNVNGVVINDVKMQGNRLVYTGPGDCPFPSCQNLAAAPGEPDTFTVTYYNSYRPDGLGAYAAGVLAMEFALACSGRECRLPRGTTSVSRQGISVEIAAGSFPSGLTGIEEVDAYLGLWRHDDSPRQAPRFWSPRSSSPRVER